MNAATQGNDRTTAAAQSSCLGEAADKARLRWMLIGVGFGTGAVALIWRHKRRSA